MDRPTEAAAAAEQALAEIREAGETDGDVINVLERIRRTGS